MPMNEIIVRFDKMMGGNKKMEKREMQVRDSIPILEEANPNPSPNPNLNHNHNQRTVQLRDRLLNLLEVLAQDVDGPGYG